MQSSKTITVVKTYVFGCKSTQKNTEQRSYSSHIIMLLQVSAVTREILTLASIAVATAWRQIHVFKCGASLPCLSEKASVSIGNPALHVLDRCNAIPAEHQSRLREDHPVYLQWMELKSTQGYPQFLGSWQELHALSEDLLMQFGWNKKGKHQWIHVQQWIWTNTCSQCRHGFPIVLHSMQQILLVSIQTSTRSHVKKKKMNDLGI